MPEKNGLVTPETSEIAAKREAEAAAKSEAEAEELQQHYEHNERRRAIDETPAAESGCEGVPFAKMFKEKMPEIIQMFIAGPPANLSGEERVQQEKRVSKFKETFEKPAQKLLASKSPEWKKQMTAS